MRARYDFTGGVRGKYVAKKKKLDKVKLVKELSRDRVGQVPRTRKIEDGRVEQEESCDYCAIRGCEGDCLAD